MTETYELFALKYAFHDRPAAANFVFPPVGADGDLHEGNMPIDYFVWVAKNDDRAVVIDTGFNAEESAKRGRTHLRCPAESLSLLGVDPATVEDVIVTHMHYDHAGNLDKFPNATFHLQDAEMAYATGRYMRHPALRGSFEVEHVTDMVRKVFGDKVKFHNGDADLFPGIKLHFIGGHTMGMQSVTVETKRGRVVVASDALHLYLNMIDRNPFQTVFNIGDMMDGHIKLMDLADGDENMIVPGHDPQVFDLYPAPSDDLKGIVVRLDVPPNT